jgi:hypothetical protein
VKTDKGLLRVLWTIYLLTISIVAIGAGSEAIANFLKSGVNDQWLGFAGSIVGGLMTAAAGIAAWIAVRRTIDANSADVNLQISSQKQADADRAKALAANLARALHAELADLVARCCFDSEGRWKRYWPANAQIDLLAAHELRPFAPTQPTIFSNASSELASLGADAPLRLVQFYNSLTALRRDIGDIADGLTGNPANQALVRQIAKRFLFTLRPGLDALHALGCLVPNAEDVERLAIEAYDANRQDGPPPDGTLRVRIKRLLKSTEAGAR